MSVDDLHGGQPEKGRTPVILLAEDEILIRMASAEWLRDAGMVVIEASNGAEALDLLHGGQEIDLLVTDISMPGSPDGLELAALAREVVPGLPVVLASARLPDEGSGPAIRMLPKPYDVPGLLSLVTEMLGAAWRPLESDHKAR